METDAVPLFGSSSYSHASAEATVQASSAATAAEITTTAVSGLSFYCSSAVTVMTVSLETTAVAVAVN